MREEEDVAQYIVLAMEKTMLDVQFGAIQSPYTVSLSTG
jgi:hypothetical protein